MLLTQADGLKFAKELLHPQNCGSPHNWYL